MKYRNPQKYRWSLLILLLFALVSLTACGGGSDEPEPADTSATESSATNTPVPPAPPTDTPVTDSDSQSGSTDNGAGASSGNGSTEDGVAGLEPVQRDGIFDTPPEMAIDTSKFYYATFKTEKGDIKVQLFAQRAPVTVNNFVFLARQGFYDNTMFHRVLDNFMAQGGDPSGTGRGGPGYRFQDEFDPSLTFDRPGLLAMANAGPGTNGSQFFLTFVPTPHLDNRHTIFGEIIEGNEILDLLTRRDPGQNPNFAGDTISTIEIEELDTSTLPTPLPPPPPFAPSSMDSEGRPLAALSAEERTGYFNTAPEMQLDTSMAYSATISTSKGDLVLSLYDDLAPTAVNNFVILANLGFYDNLPINTVAPGQFVVMGSPDNQASSDAGYRFLAEMGIDVPMALGLLAYFPVQQSAEGILSSSSQIFLTLSEPPPSSNQQFSAFGQLVAGTEILTELTADDRIESVTITTTTNE